MSTGFRLFLLTISAFGAIAVYRLRTPELSRWLRQTPSGRADPAGGPLVSPVDRILEPDVSLAMIRLS